MFADGIMESSSTLGLVSYTLSGSVYNGLTFGQKFEDGDPVVFIVQTLTRSKFEIVLGEYDAGPPRRLLRTTVLSSSAAGSTIDWQADDVYYIASFASADVLAGLVNANHDTLRPWWVKFGRWLKKNFPSAGLSTDYFFDGTSDIKLGVVNTATHKYHSVYMPAGAIVEWAGAAGSVPQGFLLCNGQSVLRSSYPDLFAAIGTTYGAADASHFNVPDKRGRFTVGVDPDATGRITLVDVDTLGNTGGAQSVAVTIDVEGETVPGETSGDTAPGVRGGGSQDTSQPGHTHDIPALSLDLTVTAPSSITTVPPLIAMNYMISTGGV